LRTSARARDAYLRSADFLDVEHHPTVTFRSTRIEGFVRAFQGDRRPDDSRGDRQVMLETELNGRGRRSSRQRGCAGLGPHTDKGNEFGLSWNVAVEAGGLLVSDPINIELDVQAVRQM
jgi:polyisoprenoid-binding protein YceI